LGDGQFQNTDAKQDIGPDAHQLPQRSLRRFRKWLNGISIHEDE
jgi:hypothetical protein